MQVNRKRTVSYAVIIILVVFGIFLVQFFTLPDTKTLSVSFLNVGEGSSVLIHSPSGRYVLINGGPDRSVLRILGDRLGSLNRTIDMIIETDTKSADIFGLIGVLNRYRIRSLVTPSAQNNTITLRMLAAVAARDKGTVHIEATDGMRFMIGGGAYIEVLSAGYGNISKDVKSLVLRLVYGKTSFMLPSFSMPKTQNNLSKTLYKKQLKSDVLSVGHYGATNSVDVKWLKSVNPDTAVISVGKNKYRYPSQSTIKLLLDKGAKVLTTSKNGTITFVSDGVSVRHIQ